MNRVYRSAGVTALLMLVAGALGAVLILGAATVLNGSEATMRIEPHVLTKTVGETFDVQIMVDASSPVNVFSGELSFDPQIVTIAGIDYDTSIADLWAIRPWYENGDGTMNFGGGTTKKGGFMGTGALITVHFKARAPGNANVIIHDARIFRHDGLGTDVPLPGPIDAILTIVPTNIPMNATRVFVATEPPSLDINGDGKQSFADVSVMMLHLFSNDVRYDLNQDGVVNRTDLGMVLNSL